MNIGNQFIKRLRDAVSNSRTRLGVFRSKRNDFIRQYVGKNYSQDGTSNQVPVNLLAQVVDIYARSLVAKNPQVLVDCHAFELKAGAHNFELGMNHLLKEIQFSKTARSIVKDALFTMGIAKTGISAVDAVEVDGIFHDIGQPYIDRVSFDDWVHDIEARDPEEFAFCGNKFRLPLERVKESTRYANVGDLAESADSVYDEDGGEKTSHISRGSEGHNDKALHKYIDLWEVYLPQENVMLTLPVEGGKPILEEEWEGPESGPYKLLRFIEVPDQVVSLSACAKLYDLHLILNQVYRKLGRQAERQKSFVGVQAAAAADGEKIVNVNDGEAIKLTHVDGVKEYSVGGIAQENMAFFIDALGRGNWLAGNLDALGGLGAMSDTVGQDEMLTASASKLVQDFVDVNHNFTKEIVEDAGWYLWRDPLIQFPMVKRVPDTDIEIPIVWGPEDREGDFYDYNVDIIPHSMTNDSPQQKLASLRMIWNEFIAPYMDYYIQAGAQPNFQALLAEIGRYTNMPIVHELMRFGEPSPYAPQVVQAGQGGNSSPVTRRENVRINRSAGTRQGNDNAMMQTLLGAGVQDSQMNNLGGSN